MLQSFILVYTWPWSDLGLSSIWSCTDRTKWVHFLMCTFFPDSHFLFSFFFSVICGCLFDNLCLWAIWMISLRDAEETSCLQPRMCSFNSFKSLAPSWNQINFLSISTKISIHTVFCLTVITTQTASMHIWDSYWLHRYCGFLWLHCKIYHQSLIPLESIEKFLLISQALEQTLNQLLV